MKLNYKKTIYVGLAFFAISLFWQVYDSTIQDILVETFNFSHFKKGIIMALDNILALFMLPLFGHLSDKTKTKWGRRTPYIVCGTVLASLTFVFVAVANSTKNLAFFLVSLGFVLLAMSTFRSPAVALMPDVTIKPLRSKANAIINLMGALGGLISLGLIAVLNVKSGNYLPLYATISGIMILSLVLFLIFVKEPKFVTEMEDYTKELGIIDEEDEANTVEEQVKLKRDKLKSMIFLLASVFLWYMAYNAVTSSYTNFARAVWGIQGGGFALPLLVAQGAAIIMFIPVGALATKIGRKKTILIGVVAMAVAFGMAFLLGSNLFGLNVSFAENMYKNPYFYLFSLFFALTGMGWATINVNSYPMVVEMSKDATVGKYTGYYYTASMAAQIITPMFSGLLMDKTSPKILFIYATIFMILAFVSMIFVKHGDVNLKKNECETK